MKKNRTALIAALLIVAGTAACENTSTAPVEMTGAALNTATDSANAVNGGWGGSGSRNGGWGGSGS